MLIEAGAVVTPSVCQGILESRARGLLQLFQRKGLLPRTLEFLTALGDLDAVRTALDENGHDLAPVNEAFVCACRFQHEAVASLLLERSIALDPDLGRHIDGSVGRRAFLTHFIEKGRSPATGAGLWIAFVMDQVSRGAHDGDVTAFVSGLQREPRLLGDDWVDFLEGLVGAATLNDRGAIIAALLDLDPARRTCLSTCVSRRVSVLFRCVRTPGNTEPPRRGRTSRRRTVHVRLTRLTNHAARMSRLRKSSLTPSRPPRPTEWAWPVARPML